jgi:hypothetical protein
MRLLDGQMTFLPIVERELRVASRKRGLIRIRVGMALLGSLVAGGLLLISMLMGHTATLGGTLFKAVTLLTFFFCLFLGLHRTADSLSEEKREGTLGFLFLTDLRGYDIVLGKLVGASLNSFYGLLAVLPILSISILLGGVTLTEFLRASAMLMNTLFFSVTLCLFVSAISRSAQRALWGSLVLLLGLCALPLLWPALLSILPAGPRLDWVTALSPGASAILAARLVNFTTPGDFWGSIAMVHAIGWLFVASAAWILPRTLREKKARGHSREFTRNWPAQKSARIAAWRGRLLEANPVLWLSLRDDRQRALVWAVLGVVMVCTGFLLWVLPFPLGRVAIAMITPLLHLVLALWITSQAVHCFAEARRTGSLELMLSAPLTVPQILRGQWLALKQIFLAPLVTLAVLEIIVALWIDAMAPMSNALGNCLSSLLFLTADLVALAWVGMWLGVTARTTNRATIQTLLLVLVFPWIAALFLTPLFYFASFLGKFPMIFSHAYFPVISSGMLWLAKNAAFILWARHRLRANLRDVAAHHYTPISSMASPQPPPMLTPAPPRLAQSVK